MENSGDTLTYEQFVDLFGAISKDIVASKDELTELDSAIGDGDLGITVDRGFKAVSSVLDTEHHNIGQLLMKAGMEFNNAAGSTMGALFGMALMRAGKCIGDTTDINLETFLKIIACAEESIQEKGKAQIGDKTMLDALHPAHISLMHSVQNTDPTELALQKAYLAAKKGAEDTKSMQAQCGRSRWQGERTIGYFDAGAVFISNLFKSIYENYKKLINGC